MSARDTGHARQEDVRQVFAAFPPVITPTFMRTTRLLLAAAAVATLATLALAAPAGAMTRCGQQVLNDWWDNQRIDRTYPLHCYREAIKGLPEDLKQYGQAADDIDRALQVATVEKSSGGTPPATPSPPSPPAPTTDTGQTETTTTTTTPGDGTPDDPSDTVVAALDAPSSDGPSSVPLPLIILGGLALLLLAAGAAGYISRRSQASSDEPPSV
jgi:hypothetical protein